ncbi:MAG: Na+/H+ antiporter NhaA, partial [Rhizobiaceae bacterium]|nr:Na+/H+ antiporter NhaA [Rhizobiaceae bacterium]
LFIGMLAFPPERELMDETKIGVLVGSLASALAGAIVLMLAKVERRNDASGANT